MGHNAYYHYNGITYWKIFRWECFSHLLNMFFFIIILVTLYNLNCSSQEIITIEIDGSNLPEDSGTSSEGKEIFLKNCSNCHGYSGEGLYGPELVGRSLLDKKNT